MRIIFAGNKQRGVRCLERLLEEGHEIALIVAGVGGSSEKFTKNCERFGIPILKTAKVNETTVLKRLLELECDLSVLAGFGQIVGKEFIKATRLGSINLHAGKLPRMRGSSPLNWALLQGENEITLSVIRVDAGVDTGPVLNEKSFAVSPDTTIGELQDLANEHFPSLLAEVVGEYAKGIAQPRPQAKQSEAYYPLRFPQDGLIVWDLMNQTDVYNRIRALSRPYPGAFSILNGKKVSLQQAKIPKVPFRGEPGRIYQISGKKILVGTKSDAIWITDCFVEGHKDASVSEFARRYESFVTLRGLLLEKLSDAPN